MAFCYQCGQQIGDDDVFCNSCGAAQRTVGTPQAGAAAVNNQMDEIKNMFLGILVSPSSTMKAISAVTIQSSVILGIALVLTSGLLGMWFSNRMAAAMFYLFSGIMGDIF